jgi:hypothetical protein
MSCCNGGHGAQDRKGSIGVLQVNVDWPIFTSPAICIRLSRPFQFANIRLVCFDALYA